MMSSSSDELLRNGLEPAIDVQNLSTQPMKLRVTYKLGK